MAEHVHPIRYPALHMYLAKLPEGIASYPKVQGSADLLLTGRKMWPDIVGCKDLPPAIAQAMFSPTDPNAWVPDVVILAFNALLCDVILRNEEAYLKFCYDFVSTQFSTRLQFAIKHFISPSLLAVFGPKRWSMLKRGSVLQTVESSENGLVLRLTYPAHLYQDYMLRGLGKTFQAILDATKARNATVAAKVFSSTECHFHCNWLGR